eukprot:TRINITY_DN494_c0_g1_i1.p1 TRINITY_DN494_c0_g1~~TRINITY_DN494_c0_g1_i1.p1  ORF type:complete len:280 (+),score=89.04 TRINITY_DN494_c0_g1_i1:90-842(+)
MCIRDRYMGIIKFKAPTTFSMKTAAALILILAITAACAKDVTESQLRAIMPNAAGSVIKSYLPHLNKAMATSKIDTCLRQSAFLAQLALESGELVYMEELASGADYEGRCSDLGNCQPGDGRRYKGRGPIQLTGRANYARAGKDIGKDFVNNPTLVASPQWGFRVAAWFWNSRGLSSFADRNSEPDFDQITLRINGCINCSVTHSPLRREYWYAAKKTLGCQISLSCFIGFMPVFRKNYAVHNTPFPLIA